MIRPIILAALAAILLYALRQWKRSPLIAAFISGATAVGAIFTLSPEILQAAASALGVGRGVDLMFYVFILVALLAIVNVHLRIRGMNATMTELARSIALASPQRPPETDR
jgi:small membrane protein